MSVIKILPLKYLKNQLTNQPINHPIT